MGSALGLAGLAWGPSFHIPLLVWNASASSPRGLYAILHVQPQVGDFAVAWPPVGAHALAVARGYVPRGVPLVKTVAAASGDYVCGRASGLWRGGRRIAVRRPTDRAKRTLPWWSGCRTLARGEVVLLGLGDPASFDGRYFGPVDRARVLGKALPLWTE